MSQSRALSLNEKSLHILLHLKRIIYHLHFFFLDRSYLNIVLHLNKQLIHFLKVYRFSMNLYIFFLDIEFKVFHLHVVHLLPIIL